MKTGYVIFSVVMGSLLIIGALFLPTTTGIAGGGGFTVNSSADLSDANIGDCICADSGGECTLRAAIQEANACPGGQSILFADSYVIDVAASLALPALTDDYTVIDGSDQWITVNGYEVPGVVVRGGASAPFSGFEITASDCIIRGLEIIRFEHDGIYIHGDAQNNIIGGDQPYQRNVISLNGWRGVYIQGTNATSNTIQGNYIGLNPAGTSEMWDGITDWGNGWHGISVWDGGGNTIAWNWVGENGWSGITADNVERITIDSNLIGIGTDNAPLGNHYYGIHIGNGAGGNDFYIRENDIAYNQRGIYVGGGSGGMFIEYNAIYSNTATSLSAPYGGGILLDGAGSNAIIWYNDIYRNMAQYGGGIGVTNGALGMVVSNTIRENTAIAAPLQVAETGQNKPPVEIEGGGDVGAGGGVYASQSDLFWIVDNDIVANRVEGNTTSTVYGGGIYLSDVDASVVGNQISSNTLHGNSKGGGGMAFFGNRLALIEGNQFITNWIGSTGEGSAIDINTGTTTQPLNITGNLIAWNCCNQSAVSISYSERVNLENNLIVKTYSPAINLAEASNLMPQGANVPGDGSGLYLLNNYGVITSTNNTIAYNSENGITVENSAIRLVNTIVAYNALYGIEFRGTGNGATLYSNDFWENGSGISNEFLGTGIIQVDPLFMDASQDMFGLRAGSLCRDAGNPLEFASSSYNGLTRPQGSAPDIGAYEMPLPVCLPIILR